MKKKQETARKQMALFTINKQNTNFKILKILNA